MTPYGFHLASEVGTVSWTKPLTGSLMLSSGTPCWIELNWPVHGKSSHTFVMGRSTMFCVDCVQELGLVLSIFHSGIIINPLRTVSCFSFMRPTLCIWPMSLVDNSSLKAGIGSHWANDHQRPLTGLNIYSDDRSKCDIFNCYLASVHCAWGTYYAQREQKGFQGKYTFVGGQKPKNVTVYLYWQIIIIQKDTVYINPQGEFKEFCLEAEGFHMCPQR